MAAPYLSAAKTSSFDEWMIEPMGRLLFILLMLLKFRLLSEADCWESDASELKIMAGLYLICMRSTC